VTSDEQRTAAEVAIDRANGEDPRVITVAGSTGPTELIMGERAAEWVRRLDPLAEPAQLLAARAHHFRRWTRPRGDYPEGRAGYLRWRADAKGAHAAEVGEVLSSVGIDTVVMDRVGQIIRKEGLGTDPQVGIHEDAVCLTFLEAQLDPTASQLGNDHMVEVLAKTIRKMTPAGIQRVAELELSDAGAALVGRAASMLAE